MTEDLKNAFEECRTIALGHYENFPVGSVLLPSNIRPHFYSLYAFMRTADDYADLPQYSMSERLALISSWRSQLLQAHSGQEVQHPIFKALRFTIEQFGLPVSPLDALLDAFEFDARSEVSFETFGNLHWYTQRSAEPVGRLVLHLFGKKEPEAIERSNAICTALQILNFIQDIKQDLEMGRDYFPKEDKILLGFDGRPTKALTSSERAKLILFSLDRIEKLFHFGAKLPEMVPGRLKYELRAVLLGAQKLILRVRELEGKTFERRPALSKRESVVTLMKALTGPVKWQ